MAAPTTRLPAPERRALVLAAGRELFGARGYDGVTLEQVAAAAGVTKPIVYRHFGSKRDLYIALLAKHRDDLPSFVADAGAGGEPVELRPILERWISYARENRRGWQMLFRDSGGDGEIIALRREVQDRARAVMAAFLDRFAGGSIPPQELVATSEVVRGGLASLILWWADNPETPQSVLVAVAMRLLGGVAAGPGPEPAPEDS